MKQPFGYSLGDTQSTRSQIITLFSPFNKKDSTTSLEKLRLERTILGDQELVFKLSVNTLSATDRIFLTQLCREPFASCFICELSTQITQKQLYWNIYLKSHQQKQAGGGLDQLYNFAKKYQLHLQHYVAYYDTNDHKKERLNFEGAINKLNQQWELISLFNKSKLQKIQSSIDQIEDECIKLGLSLQLFGRQYFLAYTKHFDNQQWQGVIQLQMQRSSQRNIRKLQTLVGRIYFEASIQFCDTINAFLSFPFKGVRQATDIISQLACSQITNYYKNLTIKPKKQLQELKSFGLDNRSLIDVTRYCCENYRRNSLVQQDQEGSDVSSLFPKTAKQSSFRLFKQRLIFANYDELNKEGLQLITEEYNQSHILFLTELWQAGLRKWIQHIQNNWNDYKALYRDTMTKFIRLLDYKSFEIKEKYESFYPNSNAIVENFMLRLNIKRIEVAIRERIQQRSQQLKRQLIRLEQDNIKAQLLRDIQSYLKAPEYLVDSIVKYLIVVQDPQRKNQKFKLSISTELLKNKTINFPNLISVMQQFKAETSKWQDALSVVYKDVFKLASINKSLESCRQSNEDKAQILKQKQKIVAQETYFENIEEQNLTKVDCLGCSRNFIYNMNIYDKSANKTKIIAFQKIDPLLQRGNSEILKQIKMEICSLLNDIQGGAILFNCEKKYQSIMTLGTVITQKMKQDLRRIIDQILQSFYPQVLSQNVVVSFVPVIANPYTVKPFEGKELPYGGQLGLIKDKKYKRRKYYEGTYVMRIIVKPTDQSQVFYFSHNGQQISSVRQDEKIKQLKLKSLHKVITKKMRYYIPQCYSYISKNMLMMPTPLDHTCQAPQEGICVNVRYDLINADGANYRQKTFKFVSLLKISRRLVQTVQLVLIDLNIRSLIEPKFSQYQFALDETAILYHDVPNETLQRLTSTHQSFAPLKDQIQIYRASQYLKLIRKYTSRSLSKQTLQKCSNMFRSQFQLSQMHLYQMNHDCQSTFYVSGQSKIESIFLYLMLNFYDEPVEFDMIVTKEFIQEHKDNWKEIQKMTMSTRASVNQIYEHLQINLKPQMKVAYQVFKNGIQKIQKSGQNMYNFPDIFSSQFKALIEMKDLTSWKESMLKWLRYDRENLINLLQSFFSSQKFLKSIGVKLLGLWIELKLEKQGLFTGYLRQIISDKKIEIDVRIQQAMKKIRQLSDEGNISLGLRTLIEDKFNIFRNIGQEAYSLAAADSYQSLDTSHMLISQAPSSYDSQSLISQSQEQRIDLLRHLNKYLEDRQINQLSKFFERFQSLVSFVFLYQNQKNIEFVRLRNQFKCKIVNFITFMQKQIQSIVFQKMKQSIWIFRLLKKMRSLERVRPFSREISQAFTQMNRAIQLAYQKAMDAFLAEECPSFTTFLENMENLCIIIEQIRYVTQDHIFDSFLKYTRDQYSIALLTQRYWPYFGEIIESYKNNPNSYYGQYIKRFARFAEILLNDQFCLLTGPERLLDSSIFLYQSERILKEQLKPIQFSQYYQKRPYFLHESKNFSIKGYKFAEEKRIYLVGIYQQSEQKIYKKLTRNQAAQIWIRMDLKMLNDLLIDSLTSLKQRLHSEVQLAEYFRETLYYEVNQKLNQILQDQIIKQLQLIDSADKHNSDSKSSNLQRIKKVQRQTIIYLLKLYMKQFGIVLVYEEMCISRYAQANKDRFSILYGYLTQLKKHQIFNQIISEQGFKTFLKEKQQYLTLKLNHKQVDINTNDFIQALKEMLAVAKQNRQFFKENFGLTRYAYHFNQIDLNQPKAFDQEFQKNILKIKEYLDSLSLYSLYSNKYQQKNQCLRLLIYLIQIERKPTFIVSSLQIMPIYITMKELKRKLFRFLNDVINSCSNYKDWYWSGQQFITIWMRNYCFAKILYSIQIIEKENILMAMPKPVKDLSGLIEKMGDRIINQYQQFFSWNIAGGQKSILKTINKVVNQPQFTFLHTVRKTCRRLTRQINHQKKDEQKRCEKVEVQPSNISKRHQSQKNIMCYEYIEPFVQSSFSDCFYYPQAQMQNYFENIILNLRMPQPQIQNDLYFQTSRQQLQKQLFSFYQALELQWNHFQQATQSIEQSLIIQPFIYMKKVLRTHSEKDTKFIVMLIKSIQNKKQGQISLEDKIELLSFLILLFDKQSKRTQRTLIKDSIQLRLIQFATNSKTDDLFLQEILTNRQLQQYIGIKSLYSSIITKKEINIISSPYFYYRIKINLRNIIHLLDLQGKLLIFDYDRGLKYVSQNYISLLYQDLQKYYQFYSQSDLQVIRQGLKSIPINQSLTSNSIIITNDTKKLIQMMQRQIQRNLEIQLDDIYIEIIIKQVHSKGNKLTFKQLIQSQPIKGLLKRRPLFYVILWQEIYKMMLDLKNESPYYSIQKGKVGYFDSNGRIRQNLRYGYKAAFATLNQAQRVTQISKKQVMKIPLSISKCYGSIRLLNSLKKQHKILGTCFLMGCHVAQAAAHKMYDKKDQIYKQFEWLEQRSRVLHMQNDYKALIKLIKERKAPAIYVISEQLMNKKLTIIKQGPDQISTLQFVSQAKQLNAYMEKIRWLFIKNKTIIITNPRMFKDVINQLSQFDERWVKSASLFCLFSHAVYDAVSLRNCEPLVKEINMFYLSSQQKMNALINWLKMQQKIHQLLEIRNQSDKANSQLTQRQFIKDIIRWNKPPGGFKPPWKIILFVNGCQPALVMIDWKKMLQEMFTSISDRHQLFAKFVVYRNPEDYNQLPMVQTPYENCVETLSMFMEDFLPSGTYEESNLSHLLSKKTSEDKLKIQLKELQKVDQIFFIEDPKGFSKVAREFYEIRDKFFSVKLCEKLSVQSNYSEQQLKSIMRKNQEKITEGIISKFNQFELQRRSKNRKVQVSCGFGGRQALDVI